MGVGAWLEQGGKVVLLLAESERWKVSLPGHLAREVTLTLGHVSVRGAVCPGTGQGRPDWAGGSPDSGIPGELDPSVYVFIQLFNQQI